MIAVGIGCRRGAGAEAIVTLVRDALKRVHVEDLPIHLFSAEQKREEPGLVAAAASLQAPIDFLPRAALAAVEDRVRARSAAALAALGVASVSEAAALAGAGPGARLLMPRMARGGVTCAIAQGAAR